MPHVRWPIVFQRFAGCRWLVFGVLATLWHQVAATRRRSTSHTVTRPPPVQVINPSIRNIVRVVGQPSFIEAYERTLTSSQPPTLRSERGHRR